MQLLTKQHQQKLRKHSFPNISVQPNNTTETHTIEKWKVSRLIFQVTAYSTKIMDYYRAIYTKMHSIRQSIRCIMLHVFNDVLY